jgi:hypothetical protein
VIATGACEVWVSLGPYARKHPRHGDTFGADAKLAKALPTPLEVTHREGNPQEPEQIRALALHCRYPDELWALCLTGMRQGEYWGTWEALSDRVTIGGTKTAAARRVVPLVYRPSAPRIAYSTFYHALVRASDGALNVHDLRKTAQRWWEDAGIPDWRISLYGGHAKGRRELATIYRKPRDLTRLLVEDAERVRSWLGTRRRSGCGRFRRENSHESSHGGPRSCSRGGIRLRCRT